MSNTKNWIKKRWFDFRLGHTVYLTFVLAFGNFILIAYGLYIDKMNFDIELWQFGLILLAFYIPIAIIIGVWHRKTQVKIETTALLEQNPMMAKNFRIIMSAIINGDSVELRKWMEELKRIEETR